VNSAAQLARLESLLARVRQRATAPRGSAASSTTHVDLVAVDPARIPITPLRDLVPARSVTPSTPVSVPEPLEVLPSTSAQASAAGGVALEMLPDLLLEEGPEIVLDVEEPDDLEADLGAASLVTAEPRRIPSPVELTATPSPAEIDRSPLAAALAPATALDRPENDMGLLEEALPVPTFDLDLDVSPASFVPPSMTEVEAAPTAVEASPEPVALVAPVAEPIAHSEPVAPIAHSEPVAPIAHSEPVAPIAEPTAPIAPIAVVESAVSAIAPVELAASAIVPKPTAEFGPDVHSTPTIAQTDVVQIDGAVAAPQAATFSSLLRRSLALRPR
jgi:hypothetical protein